MNTIRSYVPKLNIKAQGLIILGVILALCVSYIPVTHALFEKSTQTAMNFEFGTATMNASQSFSANGLCNPGDEETVTITASNTGTTPLRYRLTLQRNVDDSELASLLMVYWDGEFIGMLSDLTTGRLGTFDEGGSVPAPIPEGSNVIDSSRFYLTPGDEHTHTLKFEYHIGAKAINNAGRSAAFTVSAYAENIELEKETVITDADQLEQTLLLAGYGVLPQNKLVLGDDITLTKHLSMAGTNTSVGAVHIDLNGNKLDLSGKTIAVSGTGILILEDSMGTNQLVGGAFKLSGGSAYIAGDALDGYTGSFDVSDYTPSTSTSAILIEDYIIPKINENVKYGVPQGESSEFLGGYIKYHAQPDIRAVIPSYEQKYISLNNTDGTIEVAENVTTTRSGGASVSHPVNNGTFVVNIGNYEVGFEIVGSSDESFIDTLENKYLSMLKGGAPVIFYDILLPQRFKEYNCTVAWSSTNPELLDATGNYTSPWVDSSTTLTAVYTINDKTYTRQYNVTVKGYSYEEKMSYFMAHFGSITYTLIPQDRNLWSETDYQDADKCTRDLNITSISYSIPTEFESFLSFSGETQQALTLYSTSTEFESYINISITFAEPPELGGASVSDNQLTRQIPVFVKLDDYTTTEDLYNYVQSYIADQLGDEQYSSPTEFYKALTGAGGHCSTSIKLPSYYEATSSVVGEDGNTSTFTVGFHPIYYMIANENSGESPSDADGDYDKAKTGTLEIEYVNEEDAIDAVNLTYSEGVITGATSTTSGITGYNLTIDETKMKPEDMSLNLIASLGTNFDGEYDARNNFVAATPQDRRNLIISIPGALDAGDFNDSTLDNGDEVYAVIANAAESANLSTSDRNYILVRDLNRISHLDFDCALTDDNLKYLKYFKWLENLDISAEPNEEDIIVNNDVTDATVNVIGALTNLETLDMSYCDISDLRPLENCVTIKNLNLRGNTDLQNMSPIIAFANNLAWLDTAETNCDRTKNEWAYAYCYYKFRDSHDGNKPQYTVKNGGGEEIYDVPYELWQKPNAFNMYRKLVYANAKFNEIKEISKSANCIWLPKYMSETATRTASGSKRAIQAVASYYSTSLWSAEASNITVKTLSNTSGNYKGNYADLSSASAGQQGIIAHRLNASTSDTYTNSAGSPVTANESIQSKRYFFFDVLDR